MKRSLACQIIAVVSASLALGACSDGEAEKKLGSLALEEVAAYWAVQGRDGEDNNYINPVVRFRVVNGDDSEVGYVQAMATFTRENLPDEPWGNAFSYSVSEEPLAPGAASDLVTLRSDTSFISKDSPEQMLLNDAWEEIRVKVFLRVGPSSWRELEARIVPRQIGAPGIEKYIESDHGLDLPSPQ